LNPAEAELTLREPSLFLAAAPQPSFPSAGRQANT